MIFFIRTAFLLSLGCFPISTWASQQQNSIQWQEFHHHKTQFTHYARGDTAVGKAIFHAETALELSTDCTHTEIVDLYYRLGEFQNDLGWYNDATQTFLKGLQVSQALGDSALIAQGVHWIGSVQLRMEWYAQALPYFEKAEQIACDIGNDSIYAKALNSQAVVYRRLGNLPLAKVFYHHAGEALKGKHMDRSRAYHFYNWASLVYFESKDMDRCRRWTQKGLKLAHQLQDRELIAIGQGNLAQVEMEQGQYQHALNHALSGLEAVQNAGIKEFTRRFHFLLAQVYEKLNNPTNALNHFKEFHTHENDLHDQETKRLISEATAKYQADDLKQEMKDMRHRQQEWAMLAEIEQNRSAALRNGLIGGILFLLSILTGSILYFRQKQQLNYQENLVLQLEAQQKGEEQERKRVARELHDGVGSLLTGIKFQVEGLSKAPQNLPQVVQLTQQVCSEVRSIAHNLYPSEGDQSWLQDSIEFGQKLLEPKGIQLQLDLHRMENKSISPSISHHLQAIIREILNNAVQHSEANEISMSMMAPDDKLELLIEDNGHGFDSGSVATGFGLNNIRERIHLLNGEMKLDSAIGRGTTFWITIPHTH